MRGVCIAAALAIALLLVPRTSLAEEKQPDPWSIDLTGAFVVLGDQRETGGFMPTLSGLRSRELSRRWSVAAGAELGVFGFSDEARWIGVLAGPVGRVSLRPTRWPVVFGLGLHGSVGRIPVCNNWGLCLRFIGVYPAGDLSLRVESKGVHAGGALAVRYVSTLAWTGASVEPSGYVGARW